MLLIANPKPCQVGSVFVLCPTVAMRSLYCNLNCSVTTCHEYNNINHEACRL